MPTPDTKLLQGTLDMLILKALSLGPLHGLGIGQRIMQMSEDALRVEEGSLYPALYRIERQGWAPLNGAYRRIISAPNSTS
jgi:PadR family transcriptional regulator PadR